MVSNRVAVPSRGNPNYAGGLAAAVRSLLKRNSGIWFGWSGTAAVDQEVTTRTIQQGRFSYVVTDLATAETHLSAAKRANAGYRIRRDSATSAGYRDEAKRRYSAAPWRPCLLAQPVFSVGQQPDHCWITSPEAA
jgi:hypothetical protein